MNIVKSKLNWDNKNNLQFTSLKKKNYFCICYFINLRFVFEAQVSHYLPLISLITNSVEIKVTF